MVEITAPNVETIVQPAPVPKKNSNKKWIIGIFIILVLVILVGALVYPKFTGNTVNNMAEKNPQVLIKTTQGDIIVELYQDKVPTTVNNFLNYVDKKSYDGTVFHRVIKGFMIQGGGFLPDGSQVETDAPIKLEDKIPNTIGTISMARTNDPNSATNQFFINTNDNMFPKPGYAVFGNVTSGLDVVKKIESVKTTTKFRYMDDWPVEDVKIISITRI